MSAQTFNPMNTPQAFGLALFGFISWTALGPEITAVWRDAATGAFMYGEDEAETVEPFDGWGRDALRPIESVDAFRRHLEGCADAMHVDRDDAIAELLDSMAKVGAS